MPIERLVPVPGSGEHPRKGERRVGVQNARTPVSVIFGNLEDDMTIDEVMEQFPVSRDQVKAVLEFAARSLDATVHER